MERYVGPYMIEEVVSSNAVKLHLPSLMRIHLVVNVSWIVRYKEQVKGQKKEEGKPVTNFIQLVPPQPVDRFSQIKLHWKAPNEGYPHICGMYKSNNKQLRYQAISSCKSFVC